MSNPIFGLDDWQPIFPVGNGLSVDLNGNFKMRMGDGLAMDLDSGDMMFTTPWGGGDSFSGIDDLDRFDDDFDDIDTLDSDDF